MIPKLNNIDAVQRHYLEFLEALEARKFAGDLSPDYANRIVASTDNSIYQVLPQGLIYPKNEGDLVILCELASQREFHDIVLSPRGGGTGTNAQSLSDGLIVDVSKYMNRILEINTAEKWVRVQAGVVKDQLNHALKAHGLFFAPELSTSNRATLGGMINTDASGQGSCLYGKTRNHVIALKSILLDGTILNTEAINDDDLNAHCEQQDKTGLIYRIVDNIYKEHKTKIEEVFPPLNRCLTGYDLAHIRDESAQFNLNNILCGSEGTLAFISEAKLNVLPIPAHSALVVVRYTDFDASLRDAQELMRAQPTSIETIDSKVLKLAMEDFTWNQVEEFFPASSGDVKGLNLVEYTGESEKEVREKITALSLRLDRDAASETKRLGYSIAWGKTSVNKIWAMRKRAVGLLGNARGEARPVAFVEDTAVPPEHLADFIAEFREILDGYQLEYGMFGHVDAGVLHVRPALDMKNPEHEKMAWEISDRVAALTREYKGLFWGEHGKGVRSEYSPEFFGELYPQLQRIKAAFDPYNQLNPGKIATPAADIGLKKIAAVPTRGQSDRNIPVKMWQQFNDAVYCNGNGACFNWNTEDAMCPSWKATRERTQSPKGRASLLREWMTLVSKANAGEENRDDTLKNPQKRGFLYNLTQLPERLRSTREKKRGDYDFSHEVYDAMATCLACKSCAGQCPIKVNVPEFRSQFLALYHSRYLRPIKDYLVGSLEFILPVCARFPRFYNAAMNFAPSKIVLEKVAGFVDGPQLSGQNLKHLAVASPARLAALTDEEKEKTVVIVQDAFTSFFETQVVIDSYHLLEKLGLLPLIAPFSPNGKPLHVHGFLNSFRRTAEKSALKLNQIASHGVDLVGIDPSMTLVYGSEYKKYLSVSEAPKVWLIQEWMMNNRHKLTLPKESENPSAITKHYKLLPHCTESTNASGAIAKWQETYAYFGYSLDVLNVGCCGMSGTFGHEARNKATSQHLYRMSWEEKIDCAENQNQLVASGFSCRSQVKREAGKHLPHPLQVLLKAVEDL